MINRAGSSEQNFNHGLNYNAFRSFFLFITGLLIVLSEALAVGILLRKRALGLASHANDYLMPLLVFLPLVMGLQAYKHAKQRVLADTRDQSVLPAIQHSLIFTVGGAYAALGLAMSWFAMFLRNS